ncbi:hypothetical protein MTR67_047300 [Solanum verrucosum]|uniref:RNase H type-1 domain-containing protein n=1 Tax=Solanum verrucosum TaxID=315347 RepID=A0AAF0ZYH1_SOLVR|nr:hypothetical protein MTR67_047300 [Solanum verrucosum]
MNCDENMESNVYFHIQDEAERLLKEIELMKKNVENSELYAGMRFDLEHNETFQQCLFRLLGSHSHVQVVIYALGSMEYSFHSQFQLAVVLLLKQDISNWIGNIQVYDPLMSPADMLVFRKLDVEMLTIDENCKRQVRRPTMFYMPLPSYWLIGNLLGANWSSSCINQIFLLTNSFRYLLTNISSCNQNGETSHRVERILPFTTEFDIKTSHEEIYTNVFSRFSWRFFDVGPNVNMETSLPGTGSLSILIQLGEFIGWSMTLALNIIYFVVTDSVTKITKYERSGGDRHWLDWQRYLEEVFLEIMQSDMSSEGFAQFLGENRGPRHLRCNSVPPPLGWIKLNIYGIGTEGDQPGRFSGVFQDDTGICLGKYSGTIDANDNVIAGLEALRNGLVRCVEGKPKAQKLMVESDNVILIQYLNGQPEPNELTMCRYFEEAFLEDMQSDMSSEGFAQSLGTYRGPRRLRCNSVPPPLGWIKLNIYGIGTEGDQPGRFSGVFQDDTGMCLGSYSDTIDAKDNVIAGLEALRNGLVRCVEGKPKAQKLMVESDNVILIQYLNGHPEPNELTMCKLKEISDLLKRITCAFYHVYEEANEAARDLALRDERHNQE